MKGLENKICTACRHERHGEWGEVEWAAMLFEAVIDGRCKGLYDDIKADLDQVVWDLDWVSEIGDRGDYDETLSL